MAAGFPGQSLGNMQPTVSNSYGFGPSIINCPKCLCKIKTGAVEWPELNAYRRTLISTFQLFKYILVIAFSFLVCTIWKSRPGEPDYIGILLPTVLISGLVIYFQVRMFRKAVLESTKRAKEGTTSKVA